MTNVTTLIDNASPLITYLPPGAWQFRTPSDPADAGMDAQYARYSMGGTFTVTTTDAASASFTFNGTSVTLYGANRPNHGFYNITLDGASQGSFNGSTNNSIGVWGPLYSSGELEEGSHTVIVSNDPVDGNHNWLDLDYITFSTSATIQTSLVQDTDPSFAYQGSGWSDTVAYQNEYNGTSGHISCDNEASAVYTFQGDSVQIYGVLGPSQASYSVSLDGQSVSLVANAYQQYFYADTMLYAASGLPVGLHNVTLTNLATNQSCLAIDYAIAGHANIAASSTVSGTGPSAAAAQTASSTPTSISSARTTNTGAVVGGVIAGVVVIGLILAGLWLFLRRRQRMPRTAPLIEPPAYKGGRESAFSPTRETDLAHYNFVLPNPHSAPLMDPLGLAPEYSEEDPSIHRDTAWSPTSGPAGGDYPQSVSQRLEPLRLKANQP